MKLGAVKVESRSSIFSFSLCVALEYIRRTLPFTDRTKSFLIFFKLLCLSNKRQQIPVEVAMTAGNVDSSGIQYSERAAVRGKNMSVNPNTGTVRGGDTTTNHIKERRFRCMLGNEVLHRNWEQHIKF